jgi:hypothetical protein
MEILSQEQGYNWMLLNRYWKVRDQESDLHQKPRKITESNLELVALSSLPHTFALRNLLSELFD